MSNDRHLSKTPFSALKDLQERVRNVAVYVALSIIAAALFFGGFLGSLRDIVLPAALVLVATFVIRSLQIIEKHVQDVDNSDSFPDTLAAVTSLEKLISADRDRTDIKIIAATGGTSVNHILPRLWGASRATRMTITLQIIDHTGPFAARFPEHWAEEVRATLVRLQSQYIDPRIVMKVSTYEHLPALHGILINDTHLLVGFFGWDTRGTTPQLGGAERPHRLYRRNDANSDQIFEAFDDWFRHAPQREVMTLPATPA